MKYDYRRDMVDAIKDWINMNGVIEHAKEEEWSMDELEEWLHDTLWDHDEITGNGAFFYAPEEECQSYIAHNLDLYFTAAYEFNDFPTPDAEWIHRNPAQYMDATIRCYLLGECIYQALEELEYVSV